MDKIKNIITALNNYLNSVNKLKKLKVVRSQKVLSDYSEWLCCNLFSCSISNNKNEPGWDISDTKSKYQVKHHCKASQNKNRWTTIKNYNFDFLILIIFTESLKIKELYKINKSSLVKLKDGDRVYWNSLKKYILNKEKFTEEQQLFFN